MLILDGLKKLPIEYRSRPYKLDLLNNKMKNHTYEDDF